MNYKQNEKINQVKESTLIVGIDIGSTTQYARAFDWRGIELGKVFIFSNSREGFENFKDWMQRLQDKYKKADWEHNRKFGIVFMLAKDYSKGKMYYGFDVYAALSSGIVRYFLELCEQAFRMELIEDYQWDRVISPERQTQAAKYVSEYKVADINGYEPVGKELRIFVQYLGQIFKQLHIADNITQGEPEPNHFHTNDLALNATLEKLLSYAIMWNVLQTDEPTKKKQPSRSVETVDYHLNKIYVPYFEISYRDIRKIFLPIDILEQLLSGNVDMAKEASNKYLKSKNKSNNVIAENKEKYEQLTLFQGDKIW